LSALAAIFRLIRLASEAESPLSSKRGGVPVLFVLPGDRR
jgi:hypothetical protein